MKVLKIINYVINLIVFKMDILTLGLYYNISQIWYDKLPQCGLYMDFRVTNSEYINKTKFNTYFYTGN